MKLTAALLCITALTVTAQTVTVTKSLSNIKNNISVAHDKDGTLKCTAADGKPCDKEQVGKLFAAFNSSKSGIKTLALAGADGKLKCETTEGKPCAAAHVADLNRSVGAMRGLNDPIQGVGVGLGKKGNPDSK